MLISALVKHLQYMVCTAISIRSAEYEASITSVTSKMIPSCLLVTTKEIASCRYDEVEHVLGLGLNYMFLGVDSVKVREILLSAIIERKQALQDQ